MEDALIPEGGAWFGSGGQREELFVGCFYSQATRSVPARSRYTASCDPLIARPPRLLHEQAAEKSFRHSRTSMACTSGTSQVCLVHLVGLIQPNKPDRPNRPNEQDRLADFFSILLGSWAGH